GIAERTHEAQHLERARSAIDEIADEPEAIALGRISAALEQRAQLVVAALNVADGDARHLRPVQRACGAARGVPTRTARTSQGAACSTVSSVRLSRIERPWRSRLPRTMRS